MVAVPARSKKQQRGVVVLACVEEEGGRSGMVDRGAAAIRWSQD